MYQAFFEKFSDILFPVLMSAAIWYGAHYAFLCPRIINVEVKESYKSFDAAKLLPSEIRRCVQDNIAPQAVEQARLEAALYTASLRHITAPFNDAMKEVEASIDQQCGVSLAREEIQKKQRYQQKLQMLEEAAKLKRKMERKIIEDNIETAKNILNLFLGG